MSTKIYTAYTIKPGHDAWTTLMDIKNKADDHVTKALWDACLTMVMSDDVDYKDVKTPGQAFAVISARYLQRSHDRVPYRWDDCALDTAITVRKVGRRYLLIPYPGNGCLNRTLDFMKRHPALADFHYQDAADGPRNIPAKEWQLRKRVWEQVFRGDDKWQEFATLDIVSPSGIPRVNPVFRPGYLNKWRVHPLNPNRQEK